MTTDKELSVKFRFLNPHLAKEASIYEVLEEISNLQQQSLKNDSHPLATLETLKTSRNIRMPFSPQRDKNIVYLLDQLLRNHSEEVKRIITFEFTLDPATKKLDIGEIAEYTVLITNENFSRLQSSRDRTSAQNLLDLLLKFRLFNLSKLLKKSRNRADLTRIVKMELGKNIFTFKHFSLDKNGFEVSEDYCFHRNNYDAVKSKLELEEIRKIVSVHATLINRRLNKFGILNSDFSDYRDSKIDYLLNILLEDISSSLDKKDLAATKNFHSLRNCILKVDQIIDPLMALSDDIVKHIRENGISKKSEIIAVCDKLTDELLTRWMNSNPGKNRVLVYHVPGGEPVLIHGEALYNKLKELHQLIIFQSESFDNLTDRERAEYTSLMDLLCNAATTVLPEREKAKEILGREENIEKCHEMIDDYNAYKKRIQATHSLKKEKNEKQKKKSLIQGILGFFSSLFSKGQKYETAVGGVHSGAAIGAVKRVKKKPISKETINVYEKIKNLSSPLIPLSEFIEIKPENEMKIDSIIKDLRDNSLKIVIPVYNARNTLYPSRSQKYLIADIEYLLVDPEIIQSPESIRQYTDSLAGYKLYDDMLPGVAIIVIEKYLLTLYRQNKARKLKRQ